MSTCPFCGQADQPAAALFCANCGARFKSEVPTDSRYERLKFWGGELRLMTVLFARFWGFESLSDHNRFAEVMIILQELLTEIAAIITQADGTARRIVPDMRVLGIFGAPKAHADDPERALQCSFAIRDFWRRRKSEHELLKDIMITIGMNTGQAFYGHVLKDSPFLTVIGDPINLAARLTDMGVADEILLAETAYQQLTDCAILEHIGARSIKGKSTAIDVYTAKALKEPSADGTAAKCPILGRDEELNRLMSLARRTAGKDVSFCIITGQMGIGKTRLKEEFARRAASEGLAQVLETHCSVEIQTPYYPFRMLLRHYLGLSEFESKDRVVEKIAAFTASRTLSAVELSGIRHLFLTDLKRLGGESIAAIEESIYAAMTNIIREACSKQPVLLIFEEFNRADAMSKKLIAHLVAELRDQPVMFLMINVTRDFLPQIPVSVEEINLAPLSRESIARLIRHILHDADDTVVDFIYRSTSGNPLFTIEAVRNVRRTKLIRRETSGRWFLEKERRLSFLDDLYGVVMSSIDALPTDQRMIIDHASVIGYSFSYRLIDALVNRPDLSGLLNNLVEQEYFTVDRTDGDAHYVFRHNLLKDAAYTVLPVRKRKAIHEQIALIMESLYSEQLEDFYENIAYQYQSSEIYDKAAGYFRHAGDRAKNLYAVDQALFFYEQVIKIRANNEEHVSRETLVQVLLNMSDIHELRGEADKMLKAAEQGAQLVNPDAYPQLALELLERRAFAHTLLGDRAKAETLLQEGIARCTDDTARMLSRFYADLGILSAQQGQPEQSVLYYNMSWNAARSTQDQEGEIRCLRALAELHRGLGNYEMADDYLVHGLEQVIRNDDLRNQSWFRYLRARIAIDLNDLEVAVSALREVQAAADKIGSLENAIRAALDLAVILSARGDSEGAAAALEFVDRKMSLTTREALLAEINLGKALVHQHTGNLDRARDFATNGLKSARSLGLKELEFHLFMLLASLNDAAVDTARQALDIAEELKSAPLIARAMRRLSVAYANQHETSRAQEFAQRALLMLNELKSKLKPEHQQTFMQHPDYVALLSQ